MNTEDYEEMIDILYSDKQKLMLCLSEIMDILLDSKSTEFERVKECIMETIRNLGQVK